MKKIVLLTLAALGAMLVLSAGQAKASIYTVTAGTGTYDLTTSGSTFTFTATGFEIQGIGVTNVTVTGGTLDPNGKITGGTVDFSNPAFTDFDATGISQSIGVSGSSIGLDAPNGGFLTLESYAVTSETPTSFAGTVTGGSYSPGTTAPEASSVVAFGAMLAAGGLLLFGVKRRSSAMLS